MSKDTPFIKRAYNLGLKVVPNFTNLSKEQIEYYEKHLSEIPLALKRGFILPNAEVREEKVLNFVIRVDRSVKPNYPDWMKKVVHPELELAGPAEYDLSQVEKWLHDDQKSGGATGGNTIYKHLEKSEALATCLNLQDALAIQEKGIAVFRNLLAGFPGKAVFLWGSVVQDHGDRLYVPYLCEGSRGVVVGWYWLGSYWHSGNPALRFR